MTRLHVLAMVLLLPANTLADTSPAVIGVEVLVENVAAHKGELRVRGIVQKTAPEKQLFSLVDLSDREELLRTGKTQCVTLPVRWANAMPVPQSVVIVKGEVRETERGLVFIAESVEAESAAPQLPDKRP